MELIVPDVVLLVFLVNNVLNEAGERHQIDAFEVQKLNEVAFGEKTELQHFEPDFSQSHCLPATLIQRAFFHFVEEDGGCGSEQELLFTISPVLQELEVSKPQQLTVISNDFVPDGVGGLSLLFEAGEKAVSVDPVEEIFDIFGLLVFPPLVCY